MRVRSGTMPLNTSPDRVNPQLLTATGNDELPYVLTPNTAGHGWDTDIVVNSHGFRDREFTESNENHALRVAALGDSITFGSRIDHRPRIAQIRVPRDRICPARSKQQASDTSETIPRMSFIPVRGATRLSGRHWTSICTLQSARALSLKKWRVISLSARRNPRRRRQPVRGEGDSFRVARSSHWLASCTGQMQDDGAFRGQGATLCRAMSLTRGVVDADWDPVEACRQYRGRPAQTRRPRLGRTRQ